MHSKSLRASFSASLVVFALAAHAQTVVMPPQSSTFTGNTRGYFFQALSSFTITGVKVLNADGNANALQNYAIVKFNTGAPPTFSATTNDFTQMALGFDQASGVFQAVSVSVTVGDFIGIYGNTVAATGATSGLNSYGNNTADVMIDGMATHLTRSGMQFHLGATTSGAGMHDVWQEPTSTNITRIEFTTDAVPEPATMSLLGLGALAAIARKRRK